MMEDELTVREEGEREGDRERLLKSAVFIEPTSSY